MGGSGAAVAVVPSTGGDGPRPFTVPAPSAFAPFWHRRVPLGTAIDRGAADGPAGPIAARGCDIFLTPAALPQAGLAAPTAVSRRSERAGSGWG